MDYRPIPGQSDSGPSPGGPSDDVTSMAHDRMANLLMPYQDKYGAKPVAPPTPGGGGAPPGGNAAPTSTEDKLYQAVHPDTFNRVLESIMSMVTGRSAPRQLGGGVGGGDYIVGEEGPERLQLAPGSAGYVTPNPATQMRGTPRVGGGPVDSFYSNFYAGRSNFGGGEEDDWIPPTPPPDPRSQIPPPTPGGQRQPGQGGYGNMSTFGGAQRGPGGFADPSSGFRGSSAGFSAGANATYAKNLIGEPGGPLSPGATEQYKGMGLLPSGEPMRPVPGMAEGGSLEVPFPGMSGGMQYEPDFRPAVRGERVGDDVNPMAPKAGLSYQPTPTGIFRNFPYGPYHENESATPATPGSPGGSYAGPRPWRNAPAPGGASPVAGGADEGWKDYGEGIRYREGGGNGKSYPTIAPPDSYTPAMSPEQVEMRERDKWATPGYADRMNAEASARSPLIFNPNTGRAEGAVGRVTPGYEKGYYDAHPEERMMDMMTAANKPQMDAYQKQLDQFTNIIQGYGTAGMGQKEAAAARAEAARAIPMIQAEMGRLSGQGPEMMKAGMENAPGSPKNLELAARAKYYEGIGDVRRDVAAEQAESRKRPFFSPTGEGYLYDEHGKLQRIPGTKDDHKIISKLQEESTKYDEFGHKSGYDHKEFRRRLKDAADAGIISKEVMDAFPPPKPMDKTQWLTAAKNILKKSGRKAPDQWFEDQYKEYVEGLG